MRGRENSTESNQTVDSLRVSAGGEGRGEGGLQSGIEEYAQEKQLFSS